MTDVMEVQSGTQIEALGIEALGIEALGIEALGIELLDLGDATIETKQYGSYPITFDSIYLLGERVP